jgi:O-antigen/teichoic acid export membrane protein
MARRSFLSDISGVFASNILAIGSALLIDIVISRQLGPEGRGLYASIIVVPLIVTSFVMLGIRRSAVYHLGKKVFDDDRTVSGVMSLLTITSILAVIVSGVALLIMVPTGLTWPMAILALLAIPVKLILIYSGGIYIGREDFKRSNLQVWLPLFYNLAGIIVFVVVIKWSVNGALLALFLANLAVSLKSIHYLSSIYKIRISWDKEVLNSLVKIGVVYALAVVIMQLNYRVDILLLQKLSDMKQVGYYSLGVSISDKLWQLPSAIGLVVMSRSANVTDTSRLDRDVAKLVRVSFLAVFLASVILWLVIPYLLPLFFGNKFIPSIDIVRLMLPGILMFVIVRILSGRFAGAGEPKMLIILFVPVLLVNIILNLFWIPKYGGLGAAMATNVSYTLGAIGMLILFSVKMHIPFGEVVLYKRSDFDFLKKIGKRFRKR